MTTYTWPSTGPFRAATMEWRHHRNARKSVSTLNKATQTIDLPGLRFGIVVSIPAQFDADRRQVEAWLMRLDGQVNRAQITRPGYTGPAGSIATAGVTASAAAQFAAGLTLNGCGAGATAKAGDWLSVSTATGAQLLQIVADATADGSGVMAVETHPMLRGAVTAGAAVTLVNPAALYILADPELVFPREQGGIYPAMTVEFVEVFA